jgi:hypothetical protein
VLEQLSEELFLEIVCLREQHAQEELSRTVWGRMLKISGQILR